MKSTYPKLAVLLSAILLCASLSGCAGSKPEDIQASTPDASSVVSATENKEAGDSAQASAGNSVIDAEISGEITQWVWGDYEIRGAARLNEYYPNIKVNYVSVPNDEYEKKVLTAIQSRTELPDIINIESAARGQLNNMDIWERLDAEPYNLNPDELVDFAVPLMKNAKGEIVCVQIDNCVGGYAYNRELAKKYFGTDDPGELEAMFPSLDAFVEKSALVTGNPDGDVMFAGVDDVYDASCNLFAPAEPFVKDGKLNTDSSIQPTYAFIEKLVGAGVVGDYIAWTPAWNTSFATNNIIFTQAPTWYVSFVIKENDPDSMGKWGLMTPPGGGFSNGGTAYGIPKAAKEENKQAAWTYIKWLTMSQEGAESFFEAHATPTLYKPAYSTELYKGEADPYFAGQNLTEKFMMISENPKTQSRPVTPYDLTIKDANTQALRGLTEGKTAADIYAAFKADVLSRATDITE